MRETLTIYGERPMIILFSRDKTLYGIRKQTYVYIYDISKETYMSEKRHLFLQD